MNSVTTSQPLVSIVTPVYNGEKYIQECIESVLGQTYQNWEYIILDNCSTDKTLEIIKNYAQVDERIHIYNNGEILPIMQNWNRAMSFISNNSQHCKVVHADDWLFPECLERMVDLAGTDTSIGVVGSYGLVNKTVRCDGLPYAKCVLSGHEISKLTLLGKVYHFWSPTSLLIRSDIVRNRIPFYDENTLHADVSVLYEILQSCNYGFVHQVLVYHRVHDYSVTSSVANPMNMFDLSNIELLTIYGKIYLTKEEYDQRLTIQLNDYYQRLVKDVFDLKGREFWKFQKVRMSQMGFKLNITKLIRMTFIEIYRYPIRNTVRFIRALTPRINGNS